MCFLYSAQVVAPIVRRVPRASAGFSRLAASPVPAAPPAPTSVWVSSMNMMIGVVDACTSSITDFKRFSNSPFMLAPACKSPTSSANILASRSAGGTSPRAMRRAKPSTTAVLPTPASPVKIGLFWRRRISTSTTWRISSSRPTIGSILPSRACWVRSVQNFFSDSSLLAPGAIAPDASPGTAPPPTCDPSCAPCPSSGEPFTASLKFSARSSGLTFLNSGEMANRMLRRVGVFSIPKIRNPVRTCEALNSNDPQTQPRSVASSRCSDRSLIDDAPRGRASKARCMSATSLPGSIL